MSTIKVPEGFKLKVGESIVEITPEDTLPHNYYIGPDVPELGVEEVRQSEKSNDEMARHYWHDSKIGRVLEATVDAMDKIVWAHTDRSKKMIRLVNDPSGDSSIIIGKIVSDPSKAEPEVSFKDALNLVRKKLAGKNPSEKSTRQEFRTVV